MSRFVAIDLASLPPPDAVVVPDAELIISERKAAFLALIDDTALRAEVALVLEKLESEPLVKAIEASAYREVLLRQRINEAVRAVLLPTARGADLDNLVARLGVVRQRHDATGYVERDADLRYRYQLAPEAFSTAGPYGAYEFHARAAHPLVKDAGIYGPESGLVEPGQALTVVLSRQGDGTPSLEITDAVYAKLSHEDTVPDTDEVIVRGAEIVPYSVHYELEVRPGADVTLIANAARDALVAYTAECHRVGGIVAVSALDGCAHQDRLNVIRAVRISPVAEVNPGLDGAPFCTNVTVTWRVMA